MKDGRAFGLVGSLCSALACCAVVAACSSDAPKAEGAAGSSSGGATAGSSSGGSGAKPTVAGGGAHDPASGGKSSAAGTSTSTDGGASGEAGQGGASPSGIPNVAAIMAQYKSSYTPQTEMPEPVSAYIFGLCRLPTLPEQEFAESNHGDSRYLQDWANDLAVEGIARRGEPAFTPGAIIVKEKYVPAPSTAGFELAALGFMIKREPGFAPSHGDWEYAYWEPQLGVVSTTEQSSYCAGCHVGAAETDSIYVDGLKP